MGGGDLVNRVNLMKPFQYFLPFLVVWSKHLPHGILFSRMPEIKWQLGTICTEFEVLKLGIS